MRIFFFLLSLNIFCEDFSYIQKLDDDIAFKNKEKTPFQTFIFSTELNLQTAKPILDKAPSGLLITLGSERGFNVAALTKNATHVLMIDYDENIVHYNKINLDLIKKNQSLEQYRKFRWDATLKDWQALGFKKEDFLWWKKNIRENTGLWNNLSENLSRYGKDIFMEKFIAIYSTLNEYNKINNEPREKILYSKDFTDWQSRNIKLSKEDYEWWKLNIIDKKGVESWTNLASGMVGNPEYYEMAVNWGTIFDNKNSNFIINEDLYNRLHRLAKENHIAICRINLANKEHKDKLFLAIKDSKISLSLLDLDNTWWFGYLGRTDYYHDLINQLLPLGRDNSILLVMSVYQPVRFMDIQYYLGFSFSNIKTWPHTFRMNNFLGKLEKLLPILNGRTFYQNEMPMVYKLDL